MVDVCILSSYCSDFLKDKFANLVNFKWFCDDEHVVTNIPFWQDCAKPLLSCINLVIIAVFQVDNLDWHGKDSLDHQKVPMVKRGPTLRIKVTRTDDFLECSEHDLLKLAHPWLKEITRGKFTPEEFESEWSRFLDAYNKLAPREIYHSGAFGYSIRRRQVTDVRVLSPTPPAFTRLIAKIVVVFVHYAFPAKMLASIEELPELRQYAISGDSLKPFTINPLRPLEEGKYYPFHRIVIYPEPHITLVDTTFFGSIGWRTVLHSTEPLIIKDHDGRQVEQMLFVLDFSDLNNRNKYAGFKYPNDDDVAWYDVQG